MPKIKSPLTFNRKATSPNQRLPFFKKAKRGELRGGFWAVPEMGGYGGGCETGKDLALIYLLHLKNHAQFSGGILQRIALDMLLDDESSISDSLQGQIVGFFCQIEEILISTSKHINPKQTEDELLNLANKGLYGYNQATEKYAKEIENEKETNHVS
ncbi:hypothetical protein J5069_07565 [Candidatus Symbiopectobacterium sp. NZEC127]|uniref:hypothetical protein n=1 Tax=Candidatus Symbiopectobacterium sp. NZEC127 TaxID=2820472 RepID=UPI002227D636|nr:hypothetical protein [Candidatus Symbiopectobacterium sp. NZEC127]MCW2485754.1 hypothetical protein [Candidatus Symbiopectobacterium sp. NZEC127]